MVLVSIAELEKDKLSLTQSVNELSQNLKEQGATFRAQVGELKVFLYDSSGLRNQVCNPKVYLCDSPRYVNQKFTCVTV
jgi:hypothetical protein